MSYFKKISLPLFGVVSLLSLTATVHTMEDSLEQSDLLNNGSAAIAIIDYNSYNFDSFHTPMAVGGGGEPPKYGLVLLEEERANQPWRHLLQQEDKLKWIANIDLMSRSPILHMPIYIYHSKKQVMNNCFPGVPDEVWKIILAGLSSKEHSMMGITCLRFADLTKRVQLVGLDLEDKFQLLNLPEMVKTKWEDELTSLTKNIEFLPSLYPAIDVTSFLIEQDSSEGKTPAEEDLS